MGLRTGPASALTCKGSVCHPIEERKQKSHTAATRCSVNTQILGTFYTPHVVDNFVLLHLCLAHPIALFLRMVLGLDFLGRDEVINRRKVTFTLCKMLLAAPTSTITTTRLCSGSADLSQGV